MKKKTIIVLFFYIFLTLFFYGFFCVAINYYFIPKQVIPAVKQYIANDITGPIRFDIKDIHFHPFKGFLLEDVGLYRRGELKNNCILRAKLVDIDLVLFSLLWKKIEVKRAVVTGVDLNIMRDDTGEWNFSSLFEAGVKKDKGRGSFNPSQKSLGFNPGMNGIVLSARDESLDFSPGRFNFGIEEFIIKNGSINYQDYFKKDNALKRHFVDIGLILTTPNAQLYKLKLSGRAKGRSEESIELELVYNKSQRSFQGLAKIVTSYLGEYWGYYLDDIFSPMHLEADHISALVQFSYLNDSLLLNNLYTIKNGVLRYGNFKLNAGGVVRQRLEYTNGKSDKKFTQLAMSLEDIVLSDHNFTFLEHASGLMVLSDANLEIKKLIATIKGFPVELSGNFNFNSPRELYLAGKIENINSTLRLVILENDQAKLDWQSNIAGSYFNISVQSSSLKDLVFDANINADIQLADFSKLIKNEINGGIRLYGNIKGKFDNSQLFQGELGINVNNLSVVGIDPVTFGSKMVVEDGLFKGEIPRISLYDGDLYGRAQFDINKWGIELFVNKIDLKKASVNYSGLKDLRGILNGNISCAGNLNDFSGIRGGGYFNLTDCNIRPMPIFSNVEKGIKNLIANFILPTFKSIEGNFTIKDRGISVDNALCNAKTLNLGIKGRYSFSGEVDFTVGATFMGTDLFKTLTQVMFPMRIGVDLLASSIQINIKGEKSDLKETTQIQPMNWLNDFFRLINMNRLDPNKYSLKDFW